MIEHIVHGIKSVGGIQWLFFVLIFISVFLFQQKIDKEMKGLKRIGNALFFAYCYLLLYGTLFSRNVGIPFRFDFHIWKIVWDFIKGVFATQLEMVSNIIYFIPVGFFLSLMAQNGREASMEQCMKVCRKGAVFSMGIELLQCVTGRGLLELMDILCNSLGTFSGYILFTIGIYLKRMFWNFIRYYKETI